MEELEHIKQNIKGTLDQMNKEISVGRIQASDQGSNFSGRFSAQYAVKSLVV